MQEQIGLGRNGRLAPPEDFSRKATHCVYAKCQLVLTLSFTCACIRLTSALSLICQLTENKDSRC
jgi:hypothetical protein